MCAGAISTVTRKHNITSPFYAETGKACNAPLPSWSQCSARTLSPAFLLHFSRGGQGRGGRSPGMGGWGGGGYRYYIPLQSHPRLDDASYSPRIWSNCCCSPFLTLERLKSAPKPKQRQRTRFPPRCIIAHNQNSSKQSVLFPTCPHDPTHTALIHHPVHSLAHGDNNGGARHDGRLPGRRGGGDQNVWGVQAPNHDECQRGDGTFSGRVFLCMH